MKYQQPLRTGSKRRFLAQSREEEARRAAAALADTRRGKGGSVWIAPVRKSSDDLAAGMSHREAKRLAGQYGTVGPLPKTLTDRGERMRAYQARYITTGGSKLDAWTRRARHSDAAKTTALGVGTVAGAASFALRQPRAARAAAALTRHVPGARRVSRETAVRRTDLTAGAAAIGGGANELYGDYARKRRADARSTPAGVAGSALRRMRAYTPEQT